MQELKKSLRILSEKMGENKNLTKYIHNKSNAKLGDSLVNFIYSVAKSLVSEKPTGMKVSDSILSEAYRKSLWNTTNSLKLTGKKSRIADYIEALILYFWVHEDLDLEKFINPIVRELQPNHLHHPKEEHSYAVYSFQKLLDFLFQSYFKSNKAISVEKGYI